MIKTKIIFGSGGGNTTLVCEKVASVLEKNGIEVELKNVKLATSEDLDCEFLILASPTYGHGLLENYMAKFIYKASLSKVNLKNTKAAVIGLGDDKYDADYFIESAKILEQFLKEHEATSLLPALKIAYSPLPKLENEIEKWA